jgi:nitrite reductase (NADH) large subunit
MRRQTLVVVGNGMVGHRLLEALVARGATASWDVVTLCEEPRPAYDRVGLSRFFAGATAEDLSLVEPGFFDQPGVRLALGDAVVEIDRAARAVRSASGLVVGYDKLVLATGSAPFVPPIPGIGAKDVFVYRTLEDLRAIRERAGRSSVGAVIGGGLLGLEAAGALRAFGLPPTWSSSPRG